MQQTACLFCEQDAVYVINPLPLRYEVHVFNALYNGCNIASVDSVDEYNIMTTYLTIAKSQLGDAFERLYIGAKRGSLSTDNWSWEDGTSSFSPSRSDMVARWDAGEPNGADGDYYTLTVLFRDEDFGLWDDYDIVPGGSNQDLLPAVYKCCGENVPGYTEYSTCPVRSAFP